jgi:hypothetical protein
MGKDFSLDQRVSQRISAVLKRDLVSPRGKNDGTGSVSGPMMISGRLPCLHAP